MKNLIRWIRILCTMLFLIAGRGESALAKNFYLSNTGSDQNPGVDPAAPLATFARPNAYAFKPGDTLFLEGSSTFAGNLSFSAEDGGDATNPVVITSYGAGTATILSPLFSGIFLENTAGIHIDNLEISSPQASNLLHIGVFLYHSDPTQDDLNGIRLTNLEIHGFNVGISIGGESSILGFSDGEIAHCHIHHCEEAGIFSWAGFSQIADGLPHQSWWIHHNLVEQIPGNGDPTRHTGNGIMISRMDDCLLEYNEVRFCGTNNLHCGGPVGLWAFQANNIMIQYNESHHNSNGQGCDGGGFDFDGGVTNSTMQYNYSHDNDGAGFLVAQYAYAPPLENIVIRYNISENDGKEEGYGGITVWTSEIGDFPTIKDVFIYHNTIYSSASSTSTAASIWNDDYQNILFANNLFLAENNPILEIEAEQGIEFYRNCYFSYSNDFLIKDNGASYQDLLTWMKTEGKETLGNSYTGVEVNPYLTDYGNLGTVSDFSLLFSANDYRLTDSSSLISKGMDLSNIGQSPPAMDFFGNPAFVGSKPDLGASESSISSLRLTSMEGAPSPLLLPHPNPADHQVIIDLPAAPQLVVLVTDVIGQEIVRLEGMGQIRWDTSKIPAGTYILRIESHSSLQRPVKVMVQH